MELIDRFLLANHTAASLDAFYDLVREFMATFTARLIFIWYRRISPSLQRLFDLDLSFLRQQGINRHHHARCENTVGLPIINGSAISVTRGRFIWSDNFAAENSLHSIKRLWVYLLGA